MSRQNINLGGIPNDRTGDNLRVAGDKANDNFIELYNVGGWGNYAHGGADLTVTTKPVQLTIDGAGATSNSDHLPLSIRGISELWTANTITPINLGDSYDLRLDFEITAKSGSPTELDILLDIGATPDGTNGTGSILIVSTEIILSKTPPYAKSKSFPIFCLSTFIANGGTIWLKTDTGTVTLGSRNTFIKKTTDGAL